MKDLEVNVSRLRWTIGICWALNLLHGHVAALANVRLGLELLGGERYLVHVLVIILIGGGLRLALALQDGRLGAVLGLGGGTLARSLRSGNGLRGTVAGSGGGAISALLLAELLEVLSSQGCQQMSSPGCV